MPVAIVATPDPEFARIRLEVTGATDGPVRITRADANGTDLVRQFEGAEAAGGQLLVDDYEAALRGQVIYTATDEAPASASVTVVDGLLSVAQPWLSHPNLPALNVPVRILRDDPSWARQSTEHQVYGRAAPLFTTQPLRARNGTLELLCETWDEAERVRNVYARGMAVLLRQPCLTDADYYHVADLSTVPTVQANWQGRWRVTITYQAVDSPAGELQGSPDWTWDLLVAAEATWNDAVAAYPQWADLMQGPASP